MISSSLKTLSLSLRQTPQPESESLAQVVFDSLVCPSLTSLSVEVKGGYECFWPKKCFHAFIEQPSYRLTTLSIQSVPLSDSTLIDMLRRLPSTHLSLGIVLSPRCSYALCTHFLPLVSPPPLQHLCQSCRVSSLRSMRWTRRNAISMTEHSLA